MPRALVDVSGAPVSEMSARLDPLVRFGAFELDLRTGELRKGRLRINLPEQPFQVLKTLLEHPGELVTREALRQRLWPAETFVDFEHGLNAAVRRLRDALGDSADAPRFVETMPRRGYRFIAPILASPAHEATPSLSGGQPQHKPAATPDVTTGWRRSRVTVLGTITTTTLIAAVALWLSGYRPWSAAADPSIADNGPFMLAVLPFENLTGDPDQEYIGDGMTEELIAQLGRMDPSRLGVVARTSAMQFKKTTKRAKQIGSDLGVSHLVEGSIRTAGSRVRISVQLIKTQHESHVWAEQYERDAKDVLTLQRDVAEAIVRQITTSLSLAPSRINPDARRHSTVVEAHQDYLRGRYYWSKDTADQLKKAMEHFHRAIALDPSYALAYSGLADTYILLGADGFLPMSEAYPLAKTAALKAIELENGLGEAHMSLAAITADYYWDWPEADRHYRRAVALNPNDATTLRFYSFFLASMGRLGEALDFAERARRFDPVSADAQMNLGMILYFARRYDDAVAAVTETFELAPDFGPAHVLLGRIYVAKGMPDRAVEELELAQRLMGRRPDVLTPHAYALARAGREREARTMLDGLREISKPRDPAPFRIAMVHMALGETEPAFYWLGKALEARDWQMGLLNVEPAFDVLRSDHRFAGFVERVGLQRYRLAGDKSGWQ